jgi:hypothetical protein
MYLSGKAKGTTLRLMAPVPKAEKSILGPLPLNPMHWWLTEAWLVSVAEMSWRQKAEDVIPESPDLDLAPVKQRSPVKAFPKRKKIPMGWMDHGRWSTLADDGHWCNPNRANDKTAMAAIAMAIGRTPRHALAVLPQSHSSTRRFSTGLRSQTKRRSSNQSSSESLQANAVRFHLCLGV